jgi:hypothetical protein
MKKALLIFASLLGLQACSVLTIVKDCSPVAATDSNGGNKFLCRTVKPLE